MGELSFPGIVFPLKATDIQTVSFEQNRLLTVLVPVVLSCPSGLDSIVYNLLKTLVNIVSLKPDIVKEATLYTRDWGVT